jgi:hypothetical protein
MLNRLGLQAPGQPGRRRVPGGVPEFLGWPSGPPEGSPGARGAEEVFLRSCVRMLNRLGLQAPGQPGRRRVPGGVPECLGWPAGPPEGSPGAEEVFLRSCVRMLNRLGLQAPGQPGRRRVPGGVPERPARPAGPPEGSPGTPGAEEVFLRSCVRMLTRLGLQAPGQPGRRRVPGGVLECPGRPRRGLRGAPGTEEVFLRSCVRMLNRLGLQARAQPGRR